MKINHQALALRYRKTPKDKYYTPAELAKSLILKVSIQKGDFILDPCRGKGAFYDNYPNDVMKQYYEIDEGLDYFLSAGQCDWVITNPPYSNLNNWLQAFCKDCRKGLHYCLPNTQLLRKDLSLLKKQVSE